MKRFFSQIAAATAGLWIATLLFPNVLVETSPKSNFFGFPLKARWEIFLILGIILGILNYFLKPLLKNLSLPFKIATVGILTMVINVALIWILDLIFDELLIPSFLPLVYLVFIIWILNAVIELFIIKD